MALRALAARPRKIPRVPAPLGAARARPTSSHATSAPTIEETGRWDRLREVRYAPDRSPRRSGAARRPRWAVSSGGTAGGAAWKVHDCGPGRAPRGCHGSQPSSARRLGVGVVITPHEAATPCAGPHLRRDARAGPRRAAGGRWCIVKGTGADVCACRAGAHLSQTMAALGKARCSKVCRRVSPPGLFLLSPRLARLR
jgi:hypothetical protein